MDVPGCGDGFDQHGVDGYTDHDQEALEPKRKQGFQVVLSHFAPFTVGKCGKRNRADGREQIDFQHPPVDDEENTDGHDLDGKSDQQGLNPQAEQGGDIHGVEFRLEVARDGGQVDFCAPADDTCASVDNVLCQIEDACNNVKGMRDEENRDDRLEYPSKEDPGVQIQRVLSRIFYKKISMAKIRHAYIIWIAFDEDISPLIYVVLDTVLNNFLATPIFEVPFHRIVITF